MRGEDLSATCDYPGGAARAYVRVHLITSADGVVMADGPGGGRASHDGTLMARTLRELADVILVGAGAGPSSGDSGATLSDEPEEARSEGCRRRRRERGQADVAAVAVVAEHADLDPRGALFRDALVRPIVFTVAAAPRDRVAALAGAGAQVITVGDDRVEVPLILDALTEAGLTRVLCEGDPLLYGRLLGADAVDELCRTLTPCLIGDGLDRHPWPGPVSLPLRLVSVLAGDGVLFMRYERDRSESQDP